MRHLIKFNESLEDIEHLQETCETYLVYLLDKGFTISLDNTRPWNKILEVDIEPDFHTQYSSGEGYTWNMIKSYLSPFLSLLISGSLNYKLIDLKIKFWSRRDSNLREEDVKELIEDETTRTMGKSTHNNRIVKMTLKVKKI